MEPTITIEFTPREYRAILFAMKADLDVVMGDVAEWGEEDIETIKLVVKKLEGATLDD